MLDQGRGLVQHGCSWDLKRARCADCYVPNQSGIVEGSPVGNRVRDFMTTRDKGLTGFVRSRRTLLVLYTVVTLLFWMCLYLYAPTLPTYAESKTGSLASVGIILAQYGLWQAIVRLPVGIAADWLGRRKPFIVGGLLLAGLGAWVMGSSDTAWGLGM